MVIENKNLEAINALVVAKGNKAEAAKTLGIPRTTLIGRLEAAEREGIVPTAVSYTHLTLPTNREV